MASGQLITPQKNYDDVGVFYRTPLIYNFNVGYNLCLLYTSPSPRD